MKHNTTALLLVLATTVTLESRSAEYTVTDLGTLSGSPGTSWPNAINNQGEVIGYSVTASGANHAFIWNAAEGMRDLGDLAGGLDRSEARDINDSGQVVGSANAASGLRAVLWDNGSLLDLGDLAGGADSSEAYAINEAGRVTGKASIVGGTTTFLWDSSNGMQDIGNLPGMIDANGFAINKHDEIVGSASNGGDITSFRWTPAGGLEDLGDLPSGADVSFAFDVNDDSSIIGRGNVSAGDRGYFWRPAAGLFDLGVPAGAFYSSAYAVNNAHQIVGDETWPVGHRAAIWKDPTGPSQNLNDLIDPASGWILTNAYDINDVGQIIGVGISPDFVFTGYLLSPQPQVTAFWPGDIDSGISVFVFGAGFIPQQTDVSIGGVNSPGVQWLSPNLVLAIRPFGVTSGDVVVTTPYGSATADEQYGTLPTGLTVTDVWPSQGTTWDFIFVFGSGFEAGNTQVSINAVNIPLIQVINENLLSFIVPAGLASGAVMVNTSAGTAAATSNFVVIP